MTTPVAFLGLGVMGGGMAARLLDAGVPLAVWNRAPRSRRRRSPRAARASPPRRATPPPAPTSSISMVADDAASRAVWLGHDGALAGARAAARSSIESSTLSPAWIGELAAARRRARLRRCSTRRSPAARRTRPAGELLFLVGGAAAALERARPVARRDGQPRHPAPRADRQRRAA